MNLLVAHVGVEEGFFGDKGYAIKTAPPVVGFAVALGAGTHDDVVIVAEVDVPGEANLFEIAQGVGGFSRILSLGEDREEDSGEDRDDGDDDEKFDERKRFLCFHSSDQIWSEGFCTKRRGTIA